MIPSSKPTFIIYFELCNPMLKFSLPLKYHPSSHTCIYTLPNSHSNHNIPYVTNSIAPWLGSAIVHYILLYQKLYYTSNTHLTIQIKITV